jgi:sulfatase modifying factor 1
MWILIFVIVAFFIGKFFFDRSQQEAEIKMQGGIKKKYSILIELISRGDSRKNFLFTALFFIALTVNAQTSAYPTMIKVQGGTFTMGGIERSEKPTHSVKVSSFSIGKYEVTVAEYKAFCKATRRSMPDAPSWGWINRNPMVNVNFNDANGYCNWLSEVLKKNYRLPTEAEWEYAARGGNKSKGYVYAGSDDLEEVGWSIDNSGGQTQAVGRKKTNELGLYDMSGNVLEWCKDWGGNYSPDEQSNPKGPSYGTYRELRGGCWDYSASYSRVSCRNLGDPNYRNIYSGFRVVSTN